MQRRLRFCFVALLATLAVAILADLAAAARTGRSLVAARQKVRAKLAAATADGKLSRMEQYALLLQAKDLLPPDELRGLQYTLDRLATPRKAPLPAGSPEANVRRSTDRDPGERNDEDGAARSASGGQGDDARSTSYDQPTSAELEGSPFEEEDDGGDLEPIPDQAYGDLLGDEGPLTAEGLGEMIYGGNVLDGFYMAGRFNRNDIRLSATVDAFKGPLDLDNLNGNFGVCFAVNGGFPLAPRLGFGLQAGTSGVVSDFHGTRFTGSRARSQNFTTVGLFQRVPLGARRLKWGFVYDWLYDHYYSTLSLSQWRVKIGFDWSPFSEIGIWACIPDRGDLAALGDGTQPVTFDLFRPTAQGNMYLRRLWESGATTTAWIGIAEEPGEYVFGGEGRVPISRRLALVGNFNYVLPDADGLRGQDEEQWNVSLGIEFLPSGCGYCEAGHRFTPFFPLANNGTFAFRRF